MSNNISISSNHENIHNSVQSFKRSHLEYGNSVWCLYEIKFIDLIEKVQRRAPVILPVIKKTHFRPVIKKNISRIQKIKLPTLVYRRLRSDTIEVYRIMLELYDKIVSLTFMLRASNSTRVLRGHIMYLKKVRSESYTQKVVNT